MDIVTLTSLPKEDQIHLRQASKETQTLETKWAYRVKREIQQVIPKMVDAIRSGKQIPDIDFETMMIEQYFEVAIYGIKHAQGHESAKKRLPPKAGQRLAKPVIPKSLWKLLVLREEWKKKGKKAKLPKRPTTKAKEIREAYRKAAQSVWKKYSEDYRKGDASIEDVTRRVQSIAKTTTDKAQTIVKTETTTYYNEARLNVYDESEDITHYLFLSIRDVDTSPWCTPLTINGKRGRSGLVYAKSDPLRDKEKPACHKGCRSEMVPLNRLNPAHLKFIQDLKIQRRQNTCFPMPYNWS